MSYRMGEAMRSWEAGGWARTEDGALPDANDYLNRNQEYRSGTGYVLDFGPEGNSRFSDLLTYGYLGHEVGFGFGRHNGSGYDLFQNNCGDALSRALEAMGFPANNAVQPSSHAAYIEQVLAPYIRAKILYPMDWKSRLADHPNDSQVWR